MSFQGDLDTFSLADVFQTLNANQQTGTLHVFDGKSERFLVFNRGSIRCVSRGPRPNVRLGEILQARGLLSEEDLHRLLTLQAEQNAPLGVLAVSTGLCSQADVEAALRFQMEEEIYDLFTWQKAHFIFHVGPPDPNQLGPTGREAEVSISTANVLLEAMRRIDEWGRLSRVVTDPHAILVLVEEKRPLLHDLSPEEKRVLRYVDGTHTNEAITYASCLGRYPVAVILQRFLDAGILREATEAELRASVERLLAEGNITEAIPLQERLCDLHPEDPILRERLASSLVLVGRKNEAASLYEALADHFEKAGDLERAIAAEEKALAATPENDVAYERLAGLLFRVKKTEKAAEIWEQLIRRIEVRDGARTALRKLETAIQHFPSSERLLEIHARLLLADGDRFNAAVVYERLARIRQERGEGERAAEAYRTVLRLDPSRSDIQDRLTQIERNIAASRRIHLSRILGIAGAIFLLGIGTLLLLRELRLHEALSTLLEECEEDMKKAASLPPLQRRDMIRRVLERVDRAKPGLSVTAIAARWEEARERYQEALKATEIEMEAMRKERLELLASWRRLLQTPGEESDSILAKLQALADANDGTEECKEARRLIESRRAETHAIQEAITRSLAILRDRSASPAARFQAYEEMITRIPEALEGKLPGVENLTVPVRMEAISNTGFPLDAEIVVGSRVWPERTPCLLEVPLDPQIPIYLRKRGFGTSPPEPLRRPLRLQPSWKETLPRTVRWNVAYRGTTQIAPLLRPKEGMSYVMSLDGILTAIEPSSGRSRWAQRLPEVGGIVSMLLFGEQVLVLDQGGALFTLDAQTGRLLWPEPRGGRKYGSLDCIGAILKDLSLIGGGTPGEKVPALLITSRSFLPIFAVDPKSGDFIWPKSETSQTLFNRMIDIPLTPPFSIGRWILLLSRDRKLHLLFDNGVIANTLSLPCEGEIDGQPSFWLIRENEVGILLFETGKGLRALDMTLGEQPKVQPLWHQTEVQSISPHSPFLCRNEDAFFVFNDRYLGRVSLRKGALLQRILLEGVPEGPVVIQGSRLYLSCRLGRKGCAVFAYAITDDGIRGPLWSYTIPDASHLSPLAIYEKPSEGFLLFTDEKRLYCLDEEDLSPPTR